MASASVARKGESHCVVTAEPTWTSGALDFAIVASTRPTHCSMDWREGWLAWACDPRVRASQTAPAAIRAPTKVVRIFDSDWLCARPPSPSGPRPVASHWLTTRLLYEPLTVLRAAPLTRSASPAPAAPARFLVIRLATTENRPNSSGGP